MSDTALTVPSMNEPPRRHDITIRVPAEPGSYPNPAAFAITVSHAAAARCASILSAHTAEEICVVSVRAATGPETAAVALAMWPTPSRPTGRRRHSAGERIVPALWPAGTSSAPAPYLVTASLLGATPPP